VGLVWAALATTSLDMLGLSFLPRISHLRALYSAPPEWLHAHADRAAATGATEGGVVGRPRLVGSHKDAMLNGEATTNKIHR
jgi:hypothetical protein